MFYTRLYHKSIIVGKIPFMHIYDSHTSVLQENSVGDKNVKWRATCLDSIYLDIHYCCPKCTITVPHLASKHITHPMLTEEYVVEHSE